jgi:hypothetical protein
VREVLEETGVWARIVYDLNDVSYSVNGELVTVKFYLMEAMGRGLRQDKDRGFLWLPLQQAVSKASHIEMRELLHRRTTAFKQGRRAFRAFEFELNQN